MPASVLNDRARTTANDPAALTPSQWSARLAAYLSRGRADDDPDVLACREALSYWRIKRVLDRETGQIGKVGADRLRSALGAAVAGGGR